MANWERCPGSSFYRFHQPGGVHPKLSFVDPLAFIAIDFDLHNAGKKDQKIFVHSSYLEGGSPADILPYLYGHQDTFRGWVSGLLRRVAEGPGWEEELLTELDGDGSYNDLWWRNKILWSIAGALSQASKPIGHEKTEVRSQKGMEKAIADFGVPLACAQV